MRVHKKAAVLIAAALVLKWEMDSTQGEDIFFVFVDFRNEIDSGRYPLLFAEVVVNGAEREHFEFFDQSHFTSVVELFFHLFELIRRFEQRFQKSLLHIAGADDPGDDAIDGGVEIIESDMNLFRAIVNNFPGDCLKFIVEEDNMVAVPADGAGDVEQNFLDKQQNGTDLQVSTPMPKSLDSTASFMYFGEIFS